MTLSDYFSGCAAVPIYWPYCPPVAVSAPIPALNSFYALKALKLGIMPLEAGLYALNDKFITDSQQNYNVALHHKENPVLRCQARADLPYIGAVFGLMQQRRFGLVDPAQIHMRQHPVIMPRAALPARSVCGRVRRQAQDWTARRFPIAHPIAASRSSPAENPNPWPSADIQPCAGHRGKAFGASIPLSVNRVSRFANMFRAMPISVRNSSKWRTPLKAARTIMNDQRSPITSKARRQPTLRYRRQWFPQFPHLQFRPNAPFK